MHQPNNPMEIFKLLEKSNCRECNEKTCLAFSVAVFKGQKQLGECTHLDRETVAKFGGDAQKRPGIEEGRDEAVEQLKRKIRDIDLAASGVGIERMPVWVSLTDPFRSPLVTVNE